ncbi:hypothetical protein MTsN3n11_13470 [Qipengyuania sp. MTN3-11]
MRQGNLTRTAHLAKMRAMGGKASCKPAALMLASLALSGCITVNAPEEPIVIELNVNIRQEVIYRLAEDAGNTIDENADIF